MYAILIGPQLSEFRWPIQELPSDVNVGDTVVLQLVDDKHEEEQKFEQMRKLLEELIN
ncbi:hypothetical protein CO046_02270 [Candidatus Peregrinibacteria bacterium CG_4_9_14_0_2_um_filter_53_11]|nr:MAG: hypothetical protein CO046_02270 [Candidatus Peregrinibacteria bacterium CG_4_9_14_0_2_um_filter_53_11]